MSNDNTIQASELREFTKKTLRVIKGNDETNNPFPQNLYTLIMQKAVDASSRGDFTIDITFKIKYTKKEDRYSIKELYQDFSYNQIDNVLRALERNGFHTHISRTYGRFTGRQKQAFLSIGW